MGTQRIEENVRGILILDAGALIAFERAGEGVAALIDHAAKIEATVVVPASALAQAWRGGPPSARIARLTGNSEIDALDEARAKEVGERLRASDTTDIADAHVVCCALEQEATLVTSDAEDMNVLAGPGEKLALLPV